MACRNARQSPSPVIASTLPEASPIRAVRPRYTCRNFRVAETAPLSAEVRSKPSRRLATAGNSASAASRRKSRVSRDGSDADFVGRNRGDIKLAVVSPIKFHATRPRRESDSGGGKRNAVGGERFCRDPPTFVPGNERRPLRQSIASAPGSPRAIHRRDASPVTTVCQRRLTPTDSGPIDHQAVQSRSTYAESVPGWKTGVDFHARTEKADAPERGRSHSGGICDAKIGQRAIRRPA